MNAKSGSGSPNLQVPEDAHKKIKIEQETRVRYDILFFNYLKQKECSCLWMHSLRYKRLNILLGLSNDLDNQHAHRFESNLDFISASTLENSYFCRGHGGSMMQT